MLISLSAYLTSSRQFEHTLTLLWTEFEEWHAPKRRPAEAFIIELEDTLRTLCLNLLASSYSSQEAWLIIPGRKAWYQENRALLGQSVTYNSVRKIVSFLREAGYVLWRQGVASKHKAFRVPNTILASGKLRKLFASSDIRQHEVYSDPDALPIRLKSKKDRSGKAHYVELPASGEPLGMKLRLESINRALLFHWADLELTDHQMVEMLGYMAKRDGAERTIDFGKRTLYRVFNNGTLEDGGRFYGGWWQEIPKAYRPYITINGKRTVEVDYSAIHPAFLYNELGLPKPEDPYAIGFGSREVVKRTFNALINAKGTSIKPVEGFDPEAADMSWEEFLGRVKDHFLPFRQYFGTGYGLKLQRLDSDIAEAVMLHFAKYNIPVLPVHDSFIVHRGYEADLARVMEDKFREVTGASINLKPSALSTQQAVAISENYESEHRRLLSEGMSEIEALVSTEATYSSHWQRVDAFLNRAKIRSNSV